MKTKFIALLFFPFLYSAWVTGQTLGPPAAGFYFGAYAHYDDGSADSLVTSVKNFETNAGKNVVWAIVLNEWGDHLKFALPEANALNALGITPFIRILPRSVPTETNAVDPIVRLDYLVRGDFDDQIKEWALAAKQFGAPFLAEFGPEANGFWNQWSGVLYPNGPALYAAAVRRVISICRANGVTNITWFFHMNGDDNPKTSANQMAQFYPGDDYIDWLGISVLGAQDQNDWWDEFSDVMDEGYNEIQALSSIKPIAVIESGVVEDYRDPNHKADWYRRAFASLKSGRWPRLKGYSYWNEPSWLADGADLSISSSPAALTAFRAGVADPIYLIAPIWQ